MNFKEALAFDPFYQERIWGGRALQHRLGRSLPDKGVFGESWELVDRAEFQSTVRGGRFENIALNTLWSEHREAVFGGGAGACKAARFPLLFKILDAREPLSVQVHPRDAGSGPVPLEPKNEWWYILDAEPDAAVYAGFKPGVTRAGFERAVAQGGVEALLHRIPVKKGDSLYVPGGRCHAIGAGCLIAEVQQNSDTTYRVYDWDRRDPQGCPRELHLEESLKCLWFEDVEPELDVFGPGRAFECPFFRVSWVEFEGACRPSGAGGAFYLVLSGRVAAGGASFGLGEVFLLPAEGADWELVSQGGGASLLQVNLP